MRFGEGFIFYAAPLGAPPPLMRPRRAVGVRRANGTRRSRHLTRQPRRGLFHGWKSLGYITDGVDV